MALLLMFVRLAIQTVDEISANLLGAIHVMTAFLLRCCSPEN